jgi:hypothetical protein
MSKPKDPLAAMSGPVRAQVMKDLALNLLGPVAGGVFVKQMQSVATWKGRQIGDHREPEKNHWKGAWRIYEID